MFFQVFIPGAIGASIENLKRVGLEDLLMPQDTKPESVEIRQGPNNVHGQLWGWTDNIQPALSYTPEKWDVVPCVADPVRNLAAGRFLWLFRKGCKPSEEALQRNNCIAGYRAQFPDGQNWLIANITGLPETFAFDESGNVIKVPKPAWKWFVDDAEWASNLYRENPSGDRDIEREVSVAARFLSVNYRLNRELILHWNMFETETLWEIIVRGLDAKRLQAETGESTSN